MFKFCARLLAVMVFLTTTGSAFAEGFALYEYSARGVALGGAMMARKADPSAVAYNPALLTQLKGAHVAGGASFISPRGKMDWEKADGESGSTSLKTNTWIIPHLYYTQQLSDDWYFGVGEFSRFGLGFEYPHGWPGRFNIYEVALQTASLNPNIAWKATEQLSLAAGIEIVYVTLDLKKRVKGPVLNPFTGNPLGYNEVDANIQNADDVGVGFNVAGHYQFDDEWAAGLQYRSQVRVHAHGDAQFTNMGYYGDPAGSGFSGAYYNAMFKDGTAHATVILPDSVSGGVAWTPREDLSIEVGAIWTRWSTFRGLNIHMPDPLPASNNPKHWRDTWRFNVGVEYDVLDWMTLRAGYVWDQSPMTEEYEDYLVPTDDRNIYSAGLGLRWDAWTVDMAYAYIHPRGRVYDSSSKTNVLDSKANASYTSIVSFTLGYEF